MSCRPVRPAHSLLTEWTGSQWEGGSCSSQPTAESPTCTSAQAGGRGHGSPLPLTGTSKVKGAASPHFSGPHPAGKGLGPRGDSMSGRQGGPATPGSRSGPGAQSGLCVILGGPGTQVGLRNLEPGGALAPEASKAPWRGRWTSEEMTRQPRLNLRRAPVTVPKSPHYSHLHSCPISVPGAPLLSRLRARPQAAP